MAPIPPAPEAPERKWFSDIEDAVKKLTPLGNWVKSLIVAVVGASIFMGMNYQKLIDRMDQFELKQAADHQLIVDNRRDFEALQKERSERTAQYEHRMTNVESKEDALIALVSKLADRMGVNRP